MICYNRLFNSDGMFSEQQSGLKFECINTIVVLESVTAGKPSISGH